jgi:hypothetical protein
MFLYAHVNITLPSISRSSKWFVSFNVPPPGPSTRFYPYILHATLTLYHAGDKIRESQHPNNIWWQPQITIVITQFSPVSCWLLRLGTSNYGRTPMKLQWSHLSLSGPQVLFSGLSRPVITMTLKLKLDHFTSLFVTFILPPRHVFYVQVCCAVSMVVSYRHFDNNTPVLFLWVKTSTISSSTSWL